jgi:DNA-binding NarL/FixJ family response regulator
MLRGASGSKLERMEVAVGGSNSYEVRVLLADDEDAVRKAIGELMETDSRFRVVASVGTGEAAADAALALHPDLAVVDVRMPGGGSPAITAIRERSPQTVVMVCSSYDDRHTRQSMEQAGAAAYVVKGTDDLLDAARDLLGLA